MPRILIVDDEPIFRKVLTNLLNGRGYDITAAESGEEALQVLQNHTFDLMISDVSMEPMNGMELLCIVRELYPDMGVSMLTGHATIDTAVEAMKKGAFDYIVKPFKLDELFLTVERMLEYYTATTENKVLKARPENPEPLAGLVAQSASMRKACQTVERVAPTDIPVLICGESGTGKELVGLSLHRYSPRKNAPFKSINCADVPAQQLEQELFGYKKNAFDGATATTAGLFETAQGGTLFLDEIDALPLDLQAKLLAAIEKKKICNLGSPVPIMINVRIVAASHEDLEALTKRGAFSPELYQRLNALCIHIPPLRQRREDIFPLANRVLSRQIEAGADAPVLNLEAKDVLYNYDWPGNVRELQETIRHAISSADNGMITKEALPAHIVAAVGEGIRAGTIASHREQLKGSSFKALLLEKNKELMADRAARSKSSKKNPPETPPPESAWSPDKDNPDYW
ncbi:MAG: sigma-54-dependent Fis family transcriptional regulator [Verrucomicrobia bacterium]|nr:sigma-54-dependent Fis family transcriptional regulator [Verrucomicrobiota bacterium]